MSLHGDCAEFLSKMLKYNCSMVIKFCLQVALHGTSYSLLQRLGAVMVRRSFLSFKLLKVMISAYLS